MRSGPLRIAILYIIGALIWIAASDRLLFLFHDQLNSAVYFYINSGKGFAFVIITGCFLYLLILRDKKKLLKSENQYRTAAEENKMLADIITMVNNMVIVTDKNNLVTWVNKAVEDFTGYSLADLVGKTPSGVIMVDDSDAEKLKAVIRRKNEWIAFSEDVSCYTKNKERFWVTGEYTPLFDADHNPVGYISIYTNTTSRKKKDEEVTRQNDKLREVAWLSSHEIRRPLANIMGLVNLIRISTEMDEKIGILERVDCSAKELDDVVHIINLKIANEFANEEITPPPAG